MGEATTAVRAWVGTFVFLLLAPGVVAGVLPWVISGWRLHDWGAASWAVVPLSWLSIAGGAAFLLHAFALFAVHRGTPAPVAPTQGPKTHRAHRAIHPRARWAHHAYRDLRLLRALRVVFAPRREVPPRTPRKDFILGSTWDGPGPLIGVDLTTPVLPKIARLKWPILSACSWYFFRKPSAKEVSSVIMGFARTTGAESFVVSSVIVRA